MNEQNFFKYFHFNEFSYTKLTHVDNSAGAPHHYIAYMKEGSGLLISPQRRLSVSAGELFFIPKGYRYHSYWQPARAARFDSLGFDLFPSASGCHYTLQKLPFDDAAFQVFQPLSQDKTVSAASIGSLYTLLSMLMPNMETAAVEEKNAFTELALQQIHNNPSAGIPQIAAACGVSEATLYNTFRRVLNKTPNTVRQEILCQKAAQLLITTSLSVEEVSRECGFSSASYFRKVLFHITGKTPRQLRAEANVL